MKKAAKIPFWLTSRLEQLNQALATGPNSLWLLVLLAVLTGLIAGAVMVSFRLLVEIPQAALLSADNPEDYEHLAPLWRLLLPTLGGLLVGLWFQRLMPSSRQLGVAHVMIGLARYDGQLPLKNAGVQFFSAALCLIAGHSVGREGPSIHVGATCGSWMGQQLKIPNTSIRILVGAGAAGAIAAAFNTPLAGVIFTMEVLLAEYTLANFIPVILAAVSATAVSRAVFGDEQVFIAPPVPLESLSELVFIVLMGVLLGFLSAGFIRLLEACSKLLLNRPPWQRMGLAGLLTGLIALPVPAVMGIGYDTVNATLLGELGMTALVLILIAKLLATALNLGLGVPGGVIGPTLTIGAVAGGLLGGLLNNYGAADTIPALYAMLGMGAMMSATLNAPLAALTALLELTFNPHIIMPGMLAIVAANLTCQHGLSTVSVFEHLLRARGFSFSAAVDPVSQFLRRLSVMALMDRQVQPQAAVMTAAQLVALRQNPPAWLLLRDARPQPLAIFVPDLIRYLELAKAKHGDKTDDHEQPDVDLTALPLQRLAAAPISARATLLAALRKMNRDEVDALYVVSAHSGRVLGIISRDAIERSYRNPKL